MTVTAKDIYNMALAQIAAGAVTSITDGTLPQVTISNVYDMCLAEVFGLTDWTFARVDEPALPAYTSSLGLYSAKITRLGTDCYLKQNFSATPGLSTFQGNFVILRCWVYATAASRARISLYDGISTSYSSYHSGSSSWELLTVTKKISTVATEATAHLVVDTGDTSAYFDGASVIYSGTEEILNGSFDTWTNGAASAPDNWTLTGAGSSVARESTIIKTIYDFAIPSAWTYAYVYPTNADAVWKIYDPSLIASPALLIYPLMNPGWPMIQNLKDYMKFGDPFTEVYDYNNGQKLLLSNVQAPNNVYTYHQTDPTMWSKTFVTTFVKRIAAEVAMPLTSDEGIVKTAIMVYNNAKSECERLMKAEDNSEKFGTGRIIDSRA